ncbi:Rieske (2Fe-2S) protein [Streptomyces sp. NPDC055109]
MTELTADTYRTVARADTIPEASVIPFYLSDVKLRISVARVGGVLHAFDDLCTCTDDPCPLSAGLLTEKVIMCQCHGSEFDITTGTVRQGPATRQLTVYGVQVVDGDLRVRA